MPIYTYIWYMCLMKDWKSKATAIFQVQSIWIPSAESGATYSNFPTTSSVISITTVHHNADKKNVNRLNDKRNFFWHCMPKMKETGNVRNGKSTSATCSIVHTYYKAYQNLIFQEPRLPAEQWTARYCNYNVGNI